jgi:hypothetical protein
VFTQEVNPNRFITSWNPCSSVFIRGRTALFRIKVSQVELAWNLLSAGFPAHGALGFV